jgi:hypothetical protein
MHQHRVAIYGIRAIHSVVVVIMRIIMFMMVFMTMFMMKFICQAVQFRVDVVVLSHTVH